MSLALLSLFPEKGQWTVNVSPTMLGQRHQNSHKQTLWCKGMDLQGRDWWQGWHIAGTHQLWRRSDNSPMLLETKERPAFFSVCGRTNCTKWVSLQPLRVVQYCWAQCLRFWAHQVLWAHAEASWAPQPRNLELPHHTCHSSSSVKGCHILNSWKLWTVELACVQVRYT